MLLALKTVPLRVAKYDVQLRDASVRAVQAAQAILTRMVKFTCHECQERFPAFHPAFEPPDQLAGEMLLLRRGGRTAFFGELGHKAENIIRCVTT